jgi:hypothetical protein
VAILKISTRKGLSPTTRIKIKGDTRMSEPKQTNSALEADNQTSEQQESKPFIEGLSRRTFLGVVSAGLATAALASLAVNWSGASLHTKWLWLSGQPASLDLVGNFLKISSIPGFNTLRDYELWFQQNWLNDAISLRFGQLAADTDFVISDYAAAFLNNSLGWPAFMYMNLPGGGPGYPMGTLGIRLGAQPRGLVYVPGRGLPRQCLCTEREPSRFPLAAEWCEWVFLS